MKNKLEFTGLIVYKSESSTLPNTDCLRQGLVLEESESTYPNSILIDFFKDKVPLLSSYNVGDEVCVAYNTKCRQGKNGGHFGSNSGWSIELIKKQFSRPTKTENFGDDLPF